MHRLKILHSLLGDLSEHPVQGDEIPVLTVKSGDIPQKLLDDPQLLNHYKNQAALRGKDFSTEETVRAVEEMLLNL